MERLGDKTLVRLVARQPPTAASPNVVKFLNAATTIRTVPPSSAELAFVARQLIQVTLPHRNPPASVPFVRTSGNLSLVIVSGTDAKGNSLGIPFGSIPRLLLAFVNSEVVRTRNRRVELGDSLSSFCRAVGFTPTNGSQTRRLRDQMNRLFHATISFRVRAAVDDFQVDRWLNMPVSSAGEFWWSTKQPEQQAFFGSWIELSEKFYEAILTAPVPLDVRALRALKRSPLSLDLYAWLAYRTFTARRTTFVTWAQMRQQFGTDIASLKNFQQKAKRALRKVLAVQPNLKVRAVNGGLSLSPSRPAIAPISQRAVTA